MSQLYRITGHTYKMVKKSRLTATMSLLVLGFTSMLVALTVQNSGSSKEFPLLCFLSYIGTSVCLGVWSTAEVFPGSHAGVTGASSREIATRRILFGLVGAAWVLIYLLEMVYFQKRAFSFQSVIWILATIGVFVSCYEVPQRLRQCLASTPQALLASIVYLVAVAVSLIVMTERLQVW